MEEVQTNRVTLEKFKLCMIQYLRPDFAEMFGEEPDVRISEYADFVADEFVLQVRQNIWGRHVERQECKWPADWWQAFKERWLPAWAKRRWPVQYTIRILTARELYPKVVMPHREHTIVIETLTG